MTVCGLVGSIQTSCTSPCAPWKPPTDGETLAAVFAQDQRAVGLENAIRIFRIDDQVREIKRTPDHPVALVALVPGLRRHHRKQRARCRSIRQKRKRVSHSTARSRPRGGRRVSSENPCCFSGVISFQVAPPSADAKKSAAGRLVRAVAAGTERPAFAPKIPQAGEHNVRIGRIDRDRRGAGGKVGAFQNEVPGLAAIGRFVETAIGRIAPERARAPRRKPCRCFVGLTTICAIRSEFGRPACVQVSPPSVDL